MRIQITVHRPEGEDERREFARFPVRIGRSDKNDLALHEPYVSENHGVLDCQGGAARYVDLGSANGTFLNGKRLVQNEPIELGTGIKVTVGILTLAMCPLEAADVSPASSPEPEPVPPRTGSQTIYGYRLTSGGGSMESTDILPPAAASHGAARAKPVREPEPPHPLIAAAEPRRPASPPVDVLDNSVRTSPSSSLTPHESAPVAGNGKGALGTMISNLDRLEPEPRALLLVRAFCESLISFRQGFEAAGRDLGVRPFGERSPVHTADDPLVLTKYLLEESADIGLRIREIKGLFEDFARHHVSMMAALDEGVRAVLARVDPRTFGVEKGSRFLPILDKENWRRLVDAFQAVDENDQELHETLFGVEFAEAYASQSANAGKNKGSDDA